VLPVLRTIGLSHDGMENFSRVRHPSVFLIAKIAMIDAMNDE
jgi:hypothetical protein